MPDTRSCFICYPTTSIAGLPFPARQVAAAAVARRRECRAADACQPRTACASGTLTGPAFGRPDVWRRYLAIILDGLRPERGTVTPLPEPPLSPAGIGTAMRAMPRGRPARPQETR